MKIHELDYPLPKERIALRPEEPCRILTHTSADGPIEASWEELYSEFQKGDVLVINKTKVIPARVPLETGDILFLKALDSVTWQVMTGAKKMNLGGQRPLPGGLHFELLEKGRPQIIKTSEVLDSQYFETYGELALPPYIQKLRAQERNFEEDSLWYQTDWAEDLGSLAAPTASLHFRQTQMQKIKERGVQVVEITLHVGLGTFLPIDVEDLSDHQMHKEWVHISDESKVVLDEAHESSARIFALGTTVMRSLEALHRGHLKKTDQGFSGETDLFLKPGDEFHYADCLLTNFHQPKSSLIALVMAFVGRDVVRDSYAWAIENQFRFLSYGDLCLWKKNQ